MFLEQRYLSDICLIKGKIFYSIWLDKQDEFHTVFSEPYQDALKIYYEELNNGMP